MGGSVGELLLEGATVLDDEGGRVGELLLEGVPVREPDGVPVCELDAAMLGEAGHCASAPGRLYEYVALVNTPFLTAAAADTSVLHSRTPFELKTDRLHPFTAFIASTSEA
jgi:hypothetical protein